MVRSYILTDRERRILKRFVDEDEKLNSKRNMYSFEKAKKLRDEAKIRRIREEVS